MQESGVAFVLLAGGTPIAENGNAYPFESLADCFAGIVYINNI